MRKTLKVQSGEHGDKAVAFDTEDEAATDEARALFERLQTEKCPIFAVGAPGAGQDRKVTRFEELGETNIAVRPVVGG